MTPEYLIQALDISNHWHIVAKERFSHIAQAHMRDYRKAHPDLAFRILEFPPRTLSPHDPRVSR